MCFSMQHEFGTGGGIHGASAPAKCKMVARTLRLLRNGNALGESKYKRERESVLVVVPQRNRVNAFG